MPCGGGIFALVVVFAVGALNKDTVGFLMPWFFLLEWHRRGLRLALCKASLLAVVFLGIYIGLRVHFHAAREYLGGLWQVRENLSYATEHPARALMWTLPSVLPLIFILRYWSNTPSYVRLFIPSLILFVAGHWLISRIEEFRTYTPLILITWPAVLCIFEARKPV